MERLLGLVLVVTMACSYEYNEKWFTGMALDHFSFTTTKTFSMRYLINTQFWKAGAPIFFYCGNEGDITLFAQNTGFMWDIAPEFRALILFAEHRYYGKTLPFGNASYDSPQRLGYLSSEQALADYAVFLTWVKNTVAGASESPIIAFGGSYGGMLAAWMRQKYPNIILGSLAASAPVLQFSTPCSVYNSIVARTFSKSGGEACVKNIRLSFDAIQRLGQSSDGLQFLNENFHICRENKLNATKDVQILADWLTDTWGTVVMIDYPYSTNFLNPVPGWPVKAICAHLSRGGDNRTPTSSNADDKSLLKNIYKAASVFHNYTGSVKCTSFSVGTDQLGDSGWNFQACTEMVMPMCSTGHMFPKQDFNYEQFAQNCFDTYGVATQKNWAKVNYWDKRLKAASNIIFSNGDLDPWSGGGVLKLPVDAKSKHLYSLLIKNGAHHYDLRGAHPNDTKEVIKVRNDEKAIIKSWIANYYQTAKIFGTHV